MKIVINSGASIESAMKYIQEFLSENYSEYPIIKSSLNLYVTLKNGKGQICPDNEKEYVISNGHAKDVFAEEMNLAFDQRLCDWKHFFSSHKRKLLQLQNQIELDKNYLETAEEKNRKKENIEKRKAEYKKNKLTYEKENEKTNLLNFLNELIDNNLFTKYYIKNTYGSSYKYKLEAVFIFNNINGYIGYFDWKGLHDGIPSYYND